MKRLLLLLLLAGCSAAPAGPPEIRYGEDECSRCRMVVDDPKFAAATRLGEEVRLFDDLGELFESPLREGEEAWVHDADTGRWVEARKALYVHCWGLKSPMAYGILASESLPQAEVLAARHKGKILRFQETEAEARGGNP
ncbi:MAG: nitrous oxide reductase accessory protein NosL [Candidatus Eremiobacterota bacterium]